MNIFTLRHGIPTLDASHTHCTSPHTLRQLSFFLQASSDSQAIVVGSRGFSRGVHYWSVRCDTLDWARCNIYSSIQPETYSKTKLYALYSCVCVCVCRVCCMIKCCRWIRSAECLSCAVPDEEMCTYTHFCLLPFFLRYPVSPFSSSFLLRPLPSSSFPRDACTSVWPSRQVSSKGRAPGVTLAPGLDAA